MGLIFACIIAVTAWALLWRTKRLNGTALQLAAAAMLVGLAGYALQGRSGLMGSAASDQGAKPLPAIIPTEIAAVFFGRFNAAYPWLVIGNSYMRRGDSANGVAAMQSGLRARPGDPELWVGLGNALSLHAGGTIPPAARLAYERAIAVAPQHPGPPFFYGTALLRLGEVEPAVTLWKRAISLAPAGAEWKAGLAERVAIIERLRAEPPKRSRPPV